MVHGMRNPDRDASFGGRPWHLTLWHLTLWHLVVYAPEKITSPWRCHLCATRSSHRLHVSSRAYGDQAQCLTRRSRHALVSVWRPPWTAGRPEAGIACQAAGA